MALTNYLAEVWGISTVIISFALLIKDGHLKKFFASVENEESFFLWGFISLIIGIATIVAYNIWAWNWQIIITLLGWAALLKGLLLLFVPESMKSLAKKLNNEQWLPIWLVILIFAGLAITYLGFTM
jgi:uncharacterized membrane protein